MAGLREYVTDALGEDRPDPRWGDRVEDLLYEGETVRDRLDVDGARVVVTSHRVLAFTPDGDGPNFQQVDRPNVDGVSTGARSDGDLLMRGIRWGTIGAVMIAAGILVDFDAIVGDVNLGGEEASQIGIGGVLGAVQGMLDLLRQLDDLLRIFGALALFLAVVVVGVFLLTRTKTLVVEVAGDDEGIHLPRPADGGAIADRLRAAIFPDGPGGAGADRTDASTGPPDDGPIGTDRDPGFDDDPLREA